MVVEEGVVQVPPQELEADQGVVLGVVLLPPGVELPGKEITAEVLEAAEEQAEAEVQMRLEVVVLALMEATEVLVLPLLLRALLSTTQGVVAELALLLGQGHLAAEALEEAEPQMLVRQELRTLEEVAAVLAMAIVP